MDVTSGSVFGIKKNKSESTEDVAVHDFIFKNNVIAKLMGDSTVNFKEFLNERKYETGILNVDLLFRKGIGKGSSVPKQKGTKVKYSAIQRTVNGTEYYIQVQDEPLYWNKIITNDIEEFIQ